LSDLKMVENGAANGVALKMVLKMGRVGAAV
jgi:hypothetical protein